MDRDTTTLLNKWIYAAIVNTTLDELYNTYFSYKLCPIGTAGENCTEPCHPKNGEADIEGKCVCDSTRWTGDDCSIEVMEDMNLIPVALKAIAYSLYTILFVIILLCSLWLYRNKETPQVVSYQPLFLSLILIGCFISSSAMAVIGIESETHVSTVVCMLGPWLYSIGFCIVFGTLFAKLRRVHIIFKNSARMMRTTVTVKETVKIIAVILVINVAILTTWSVVDPLLWVRVNTVEDKYGEALSSQAGCTCEYPWIWMALLGALHFALLVLSSYMCYQARHISTRYSEAKYLRTTIFLTTQVYVIGIPVILITRDDPKARFFVSCIIIMFDVLVVIASLFGGLIYNVVVVGDQAENMTGALRTYIRKTSTDGNGRRFSFNCMRNSMRSSNCSVPVNMEVTDNSSENDESEPPTKQ